MTLRAASITMLILVPLALRGVHAVFTPGADLKSIIELVAQAAERELA